MVARAKEHCENKVSASPAAVQPKLSIGSVNDPLESEADRMADKVMSMPVPFTQSGNRPGGPQTTASGSSLQRKESGNATVAPESVGNQLSASKGEGSPLSGITRSFMESRFETDFSNVNIHTGAKAEQMSDALSAQAFTFGSDIYFNSGKYAPGSSQGDHLLAHELTHVVQQNGGNTLHRAPQGAAPKAANWWDDPAIGMKAHKKFWDDLNFYFPKDSRKFSGSSMGNVTNLDADTRSGAIVGKAYWDEADGLKRKVWLAQLIEKVDVQRYDEGRIDNEDLTNKKITSKLKALSGTAMQAYIKKLTDMGKYIANDQVLAYLNADDSGKDKIVAAENEKLLDWKFDNNRLTDEDLKDEKTNNRLRGLSTANKLDKEAKAKEFAEKNGEDTAKLQSYLHSLTTTSTPLAEGATAGAAGGFTLKLANVDVVVLPDTSGGKGNETTINSNFPSGRWGFDISADGLITGFTRGSGKSKTVLAFPSRLVITIQTRFEDISTVDDTSSYGKGTTDQDVRWGATTLRFHEGSHGKGYVDYIIAHNWPDLAIGTVKPDDIQSVTDQMKEISNESCQQVDQVGTTQDAFLATDEGRKSGIVSCNKP